MSTSDKHQYRPSANAQHTIEQLNTLNTHVERLRQRRINDPDTLADKLFKSAIPSVVTFVAMQIAQLAWNHTAKPRLMPDSSSKPHTKSHALNAPTKSHTLDSKGNQHRNEQDPLLATIAFAVFSAIVSTVVSRSCQQIINTVIAHKQQKRRR